MGGSVTWGTLPTVSNLAVDASFNGTTLDVTRLTGQWQGGGIEGTASIPRGVLEEAAGLKPALSRNRHATARDPSPDSRSFA